LAVPPGNGTRRGQYYLHDFLASQPDLNFHNPAVQQAQLDNLRFWLNAASTVSVSDSCNFPYHDQLLRDNPPAAQRDASSVSAINPYGMQAHVYDKTQPENIAYLQRVRAVLDEYQPFPSAKWATTMLATMAPTRAATSCTWPTASTC
jgi:alpha-glucosidase